RAYRGRLIRVGKQCDLGAVRRPYFEAGFEDLLQAYGRIGLSLEFLDHRFGPALLPHVQRGLDQGVSVLEVPVEAALGGTELRRHGFHGDGIDTAPGDRRERCPGPVVGCERTVTCLGEGRTLPDVLHTGAYGSGRWEELGMRVELTIAGLSCAALAVGHWLVGRWVLPVSRRGGRA